MINLDNFARVVSEDTDKGIVTVEAGLRLRDLDKELEKRGLSMPNLGSIDDQSIAGAIATGTHGSSMEHGPLSESISSMKLVLANGQLVQCSATTNSELFRAALVSLGALGIIVEITYHAVPDFKISWKQSLEPISHILETWNTTLWTSAEFTRIWWMPYKDCAVVWRAHKTEEPLSPPPENYYGGKLGFHTYHILLWLGRYVPRLNPWVEWFIFGMQYGFRPGAVVTTAVERGHQGLLMNCLYSQYVNEWALPLSKGPEAIARLRAFIQDPKNHQATSGIPYSSRGLFVHTPVEVRVSNTMPREGSVNQNIRPYLDVTCKTEPTLYLNAIMYRPYLRDPPGVERYYQAFEYLMRDLEGKPHWAKNFTSESSPKIADMYGEDMQAFIKTRNEVDPDGMFLGEWHRHNLPLELSGDDILLEGEAGTRKFGKSSLWGDGLEWIGEKSSQARHVDNSEKSIGLLETDRSKSCSPPMTATSDESFDYMAKGEASVMLPKETKS